MSYIVPKGKSFLIGRNTFNEGEPIPADIPEATLKAHGFTPEKTQAQSSSATIEAGTPSK